ncbi:MAG: hypothetical protein M3Q99_16160 [Acidobacteriota bacterium]|nr:hypothetical protein [Acidobacteriota bacterium]
MPTKNILFMTTIIFLTIATSCSEANLLGGSGPSENDAKAAIEKVIIKNMSGWIPDPLWLSKEQVKVNSVQILRRGDYNDTGKYYPVQVKTEGSFVQRSIDGGQMSGLPPQRTCTFSGSGEFRLSKNDYGEWVAQVIGNDELNKDFKTNCGK